MIQYFFCFVFLCVYMWVLWEERPCYKRVMEETENNMKNVFSWTKWALRVLVCFHFLEWNFGKSRPNGSRHFFFVSTLWRSQEIGAQIGCCTNTADWTTAWWERLLYCRKKNKKRLKSHKWSKTAEDVFTRATIGTPGNKHLFVFSSPRPLSVCLVLSLPVLQLDRIICGTDYPSLSLSAGSQQSQRKSKWQRSVSSPSTVGWLRENVGLLLRYRLKHLI